MIKFKGEIKGEYYEIECESLEDFKDILLTTGLAVMVEIKGDYKL